MDIKDIVFDREYTAAYRDKYNEQCQCDQCKLFRQNFSICYPEVVDFLRQFGVDIDFPLEIMEFDIDEKTLKRHYTVYYAVKGNLPKNKMTTAIGDVVVVIRNDKISAESYSNTDIDKPFFIIELNNILISDNKAVFVNALNTGREIEFYFADSNYFISRNKKDEWYIYCEQTKQTQTFITADDLLNHAILHNNRIASVWNEITIDFLL